jgi:hypothetical protein
MSSDEKVLDFPRVSPEENARRVTVEATRLASLAPGAESSNWPSVSMRTSLPFAMVSQRRWHGE